MQREDLIGAASEEDMLAINEESENVYEPFDFYYCVYSDIKFPLYDDEGNDIFQYKQLLKQIPQFNEWTMYEDIKNRVEEYGTIYAFVNLLNGKVYIGQTKNTIAQRISQHKCNAKTMPVEKMTLFHKALKKYGIDNFIFRQVWHGRADKLDAKEIHYIAKYRSVGTNGYNLTYGGSTKGADSIRTRLAKSNAQSCKAKNTDNDDLMKYINVKKDKKTKEIYGYVVTRHPNQRGQERCFTKENLSVEQKLLMARKERIALDAGGLYRFYPGYQSYSPFIYSHTNGWLVTYPDVGGHSELLFHARAQYVIKKDDSTLSHECLRFAHFYLEFIMSDEMPIEIEEIENGYCLNYFGQYIEKFTGDDIKHQLFLAKRQWFRIVYMLVNKSDTIDYKPGNFTLQNEIPPYQAKPSVTNEVYNQRRREARAKHNETNAFDRFRTLVVDSYYYMHEFQMQVAATPIKTRTDK